VSEPKTNTSKFKHHYKATSFDRKKQQAVRDQKRPITKEEFIATVLKTVVELQGTKVYVFCPLDDTKFSLCYENNEIDLVM
jgi:hypothetical protein